MQRPLLTLPAPAYHECSWCGINSFYVADVDGSHYERGGLFFVRRTLFKSDPVPCPWELCDLCDLDYRERHYRREFDIQTYRGVTPWTEHPGFFGFWDMPMICISDASSHDWDFGHQEQRETWLFCRTRDEWKAAWAAARLIVRHGYARFRFGEHGSRLMNQLPAYKPPGNVESLCVNPDALILRDGGPFMGVCDACNNYDLLVERPGTQWASCEECWQPLPYPEPQEAVV